MEQRYILYSTKHCLNETELYYQHANEWGNIHKYIQAICQTSIPDIRECCHNAPNEWIVLLFCISVPAIDRILELICYGVTVTFSRIANNGLATLPPNTSAATVIKFLDDFVRMWVRVNHTVVVRFGKKRFVLTAPMAGEWLPLTARCAFTDPIQAWDLDYYKHTLQHIRVMLLWSWLALSFFSVFGRVWTHFAHHLRYAH